MTEEPDKLRLECLDAHSDAAQILKFYEVEDLEKELREMDRPQWKTWLQTTSAGLPPVVTGVVLFSLTENLWVKVLGLYLCIQSLFFVYQQQARKREEVLVRCLRALIKAVSAREAPHR